MKLRSIGLFLVVAFFAAWRGDVTSPSEFRCGVNLVLIGQTKWQVLQKCGEPTNIEAWEEERIKRDFYRQIPADPLDEEFYREPFLVKEIIKIEEWEYNSGPTQFIRYLRFENGRLRKITIGDYGYY
ncbi:MAG TPA: DUF2845 domain-containing protein [Dissulfurispiraceae bacterium]|nr:DUF2845 domain-containing protein [Dissulfurispiraceae bacterium]